MLIRSQDKKKLINMNLVTDISISLKNNKLRIVTCYPGDDAYDYPGEYSTEAKAIKVLDMIQDLYDDKGRDIDWHNAHKVFQMPTDQEVEV